MGLLLLFYYQSRVYCCCWPLQFHPYYHISMMIENLIREQFVRGENKKYLISNNQIAHYRMHLFVEDINMKSSFNNF